MSRTLVSAILTISAVLALASSTNADEQNSAKTKPRSKPNVIVVMIDDMGYGDLSCHGSPFIKTPNLDGLYQTGVRLTDFHVAPMCSPTRGQLLTGLDALRNGSSIVSSSRMMVRESVPMAPAYFKRAGYVSGQFGKWHLGENHPHRPDDRGFDECLWFPLQEISSFSDHWENDYFDPVLRRRNSQTEKFTGYCTDILFAEATRWMKSQADASKPFFCYIPLNVCHGPQWALQADREAVASQFPKLSPGHVNYLAMLANADSNFGRLEVFLAENKLRDNTIVVFLSDNGGYALVGHHNAGMRGGKSRLTEGGHRVPCLIRWPAGSVSGGRDIAGLTQVQDLLPTLLDLTGAPLPDDTRFDGTSLAAALRGKAAVPDRTLVVQYGDPKPFEMTCVMRGRWRYLSDRKGRAMGGPELYDLNTDPMQERNLVDTRPEVAAELREAYDKWWSTVEPVTRQRATISLGHKDAVVARLCTAEWRSNAIGGVAPLRSGIKRRGVWDVNVVEPGEYEFSLSRWPEESHLAIRAAAPAWTPRDTSNPDHPGFPAGEALPISNAEIRIGEQTATKPVGESDAAAVFRVTLPAGLTELECRFTRENGQQVCPAFFVSVRRVGA